MSIRIEPVTSSNKKAFESLFESRGSPHYCWCMLWRNKPTAADKSVKKELMLAAIDDNVPVGLLAYSGEIPVAWCSVAPRDTYRNLNGDKTRDKVWSLVCFFIKKEFRGQGIGRQLIREAKKYAKKKGAQYLEAYPVVPESNSYRFMGLVPVFESLGFKFVKMAGTKRHVMISRL